MKRLKFWLAGLLFVLLVVVMAVNVNMKYGATKVQDVCLRNTEALAQGESEEGDCAGAGNVDCMGGKYKYSYGR